MSVLSEYSYRLKEFKLHNVGVSVHLVDRLNSTV